MHILTQCQYLQDARINTMRMWAPEGIQAKMLAAEHDMGEARELTGILLDAMTTPKSTGEEILIDGLLKDYLSRVDSYMLLITGTSLLAEAWTNPKMREFEQEREENWDEMVALADHMQGILGE